MALTRDVFFPAADLLPQDALSRWSRSLDVALERLNQPSLAALYQEIQRMAPLEADLVIDGGAVATSIKSLEPGQIPQRSALAHRLAPWRKGPFRLGELFIDAEWRSEKKWQRLEPALGSLSGKRVADVGCNNGYYLFRLAHCGAHGIGFDPTVKYWLQYQFVVAHFARLPIAFMPLSFDALRETPRAFDIILAMGLNYHVREPLELFHICHEALQEGGTFVCESIVVPGEGRLQIYPAGKYAGVGGVFAVPTVAAVKAQLEAVGFTSVTLQHLVRMETGEQRATSFSAQKSLADALRDDGRSVEGYPPLYRAAFLASAR